MEACDSMFWYKLMGICITMILALSGMIWGNHRYTNRRIDLLNSAVGKDVGELKKNVNCELGKVKEHIGECEKGTLEKMAEVKDDFKNDIEKVVTKLEATFSIGQKAIFDELKHLRRKQGE